MSEWREAIRSVRAPFLATRLAVPLIGLLAVYSIGYPPGEPRMRASKNELANLAMRWDAGWYITIARNGYYYNRNRSERQFNIAFFPAYPLLIRAVRPIFGRRDASYLTAGVFISHVAFFGALVLLYALARSDLGDDASARGAVVLLACYPFSVFHATAYTESLFLLAVLGAIVALRRQQWRYAIVAGILAGLTRPNGFLLAATLATMAATTPMRQQLRDGKTRLAALAVIAAPVVGMALFSIYVGIETGNPFQWSAQHAAWGRSLEAARWSQPFTVIKEQGFSGYVSTLPLDFLNAVPTIAALALDRACLAPLRAGISGVPRHEPPAAAADGRHDVHGADDGDDVPAVPVAGNGAADQHDHAGHRLRPPAGLHRGAVLHVASPQLTRPRLALVHTGRGAVYRPRADQLVSVGARAARDDRAARRLVLLGVAARLGRAPDCERSGAPVRRQHLLPRTGDAGVLGCDAGTGAGGCAAEHGPASVRSWSTT